MATTEVYLVSGDGSSAPASSSIAETGAGIPILLFAVLCVCAVVALVASRRLAAARGREVPAHAAAKQTPFMAVVLAVVVAFGVGVACFASHAFAADGAGECTSSAEVVATAAEDGTITVPQTTLKNDTGYVVTLKSAAVKSDQSFVSDWTNDGAGKIIEPAETLTINWTANSKVPSSWDKTGKVHVGTITYNYSYDPALRQSVAIEGATDGKVEWGSSLKAVVTGAQEDAELQYVWYVLNEDGTVTAIEGASGQTYVPEAGYVGKTVMVKVTDARGKYTGSLDSDGVEVTTKSIDQATVKLDSESLVYNGKSQSPTITVTLADGTVLEEDDYEIVSGGAGTNAGSYTLTINGTGKYAGKLSADWKITPRPITVSGITAESKVYDGNAGATLQFDGVTLDGLVESDKGKLSVSATGAFAGEHGKDAGTGKTVNITGLALSGDAVGNYELAAEGQQATAMANITPKPVGVTWGDVTFTYNGGDQAPTVTLVATDIVEGDTVGTTVTVKKGTAEVGAGGYTNVGDDYSATVALTNANYKLADSSDETKAFAINKAPITVSGITAESKVYDGNTGATLKFDGVTLDGLVESDKGKLSVSATGAFAGEHGKDAGTGKTVNITGLALSGDAVGNYELAAEGQQATAMANITPKPVGVTWGDVTFTYNGGDQAPTVTLVATDIVEGDTVGTTVTVKKGTAEVGAGGYTNVGDDYSATVALTNANYKLADSSDETKDFTINKKQITASGVVADERVYDGTTGATFTDERLSNIQFTGLVAGDEAKVSVASVAGAFADKNVGIGKNVTVTSLVLGGDAKDNYELAALPTATGTITVRTVTVGWSAASFTYNGKDQAPAPTLGNVVEGDTVTPTVAVKKGGTAVGTGEHTNVGTDYSASVTGLGDSNYQLPTDGSADKAFTIAQRSITSADIALAASSFDYNGSEQGVTISGVTLTLEDGTKLTLQVTTDYTIEADTDTGTDANAYTLKINGTGNYKDTATATWTINPRSINTDKTKITVGDLTYNTEEQTVTPSSVTVTLDDGTVLTLGADDYTIKEGTNKGTDVKTAGYTLTITGKGNYKDSKDAAWKINPLDITNAKVEITTEPEDGIYTGDAITATVSKVTLKLDETKELELKENTAWTIGKKGDKESVTEATETGTYNIFLPAVSPNYTGTATGEWDILPEEITIVYHGNGATAVGEAKATGDDSTTEQVVQFSKDVTEVTLDANPFRKSDGYVYTAKSKWTKDKAGSVESFADKATISKTDVLNSIGDDGKVHLYAQWEEKPATGSYWFAPGKGKTGYTNPEEGITRDQSQIDEDMKLLHGTLTGHTTNSEGKTADEVKTFYNSYSSNDVYHLYTKWNGSDGTGDNAYVEFRIIQVGEHDSDGSAMTLMATHSLPTAKRMNATATNAGGWTGSEMYKTTIDSYVAAGLKDLSPMAVAKKSTAGSYGSWSDTTTSDRFWLLSYTELCGTSNSYYMKKFLKAEGTQYTWCTNNVSGLSGNDSIKDTPYTRSGTKPAEVHEPGSNIAYGWLRSPCIFAESTNRFALMNSTGWGTINLSAEFPLGVVPAFAF